MLRYENETGKGDHRQIARREEPFRFECIEAARELLNAGRFACWPPGSPRRLWRLAMTARVMIG